MLRQLGIVTVSIVLAVFAVLAAILLVSQSPWMAIGPVMGSAALGYVAYRFLFTPSNGQKFSMIVALWIITTMMAVLLLSAEKWWK